MGKRNRRRRQEEQRRQRRAGAAPPSARAVIWAAVGARHERDLERYGELLAVLAARSPGPAAEVGGIVAEVAGELRLRNWEAAELMRQLERREGVLHSRYLARVLAGSPPTGPGDLAVAIEALAVLATLPPLPPLRTSSPGRARPGHDPRMLEKVRALLAKAESTTYPEEAEALSAKAQELMARHSIDDAVVAAGEGGQDPPGGLRLPVDDPYAKAKSVLLSVVAAANRCRAVWSEGLGFSTVIGFDGDLQAVEVLYTSLLVQATSAMVAAGRHVDRSGRSRTRSFRQAFLLAYATRIGHRLRAAEAAVQAAAAEAYGAALLPVLADREAAVDAARDAAFPGAVHRSVSVSNAAGWAAGSAAADLASLSGRTEVPA